MNVRCASCECAPFLHISKFVKLCAAVGDPAVATNNKKRFAICVGLARPRWAHGGGGARRPRATKCRPPTLAKTNLSFCCAPCRSLHPRSPEFNVVSEDAVRGGGRPGGGKTKKHKTRFTTTLNSGVKGLGGMEPGGGGGANLCKKHRHENLS